MLDKSIKWKAQQLKVKRRRRDDFNYDFRLKRDSSTQVFVNDPLWNITWYLSRGLTSNLPDMNVTGAWALGYTGQGVVVSVLDDGLERTHPDLVKNYDPNASYNVNAYTFDPTPRYNMTIPNRLVIYKFYFIFLTSASS
jgi:subtilisin family serine protease